MNMESIPPIPGAASAARFLGVPGRSAATGSVARQSVATAPAALEKSADGGRRSDPDVGRAELEARVEAENGFLESLNHELRFRVHEDSGQLFVQMVDRRNGEVLRESPPPEFLDLIVRLREMVAVFLDEMS